MVPDTIRAEISDYGWTAYIRLPGHPDSGTPEQYGCVARTVDIVDVIDEYKGPRIHLDFGKDGTLIGIEILAQTHHTDEQLREIDRGDGTT